MSEKRAPSALALKRIAGDTSQSVLTVPGVEALPGVEAQQRAVLRRDPRRGRWVAFFARLAPTGVVLEACGGAPHAARPPSQPGHRVGLIPPQYLKPGACPGEGRGWPHRAGPDDDRRGVSASAARGRCLTAPRCQERRCAARR